MNHTTEQTTGEKTMTTNKTVTVSLDLGEMFIDGEDHHDLSFAEALADALKMEAKNKVRQMVSAELENLVREAISGHVDGIISSVVYQRLEALHETEEFKTQFSGQTSVAQVINSKLSDTLGGRSLNDYVAKLASKYADEVKSKYDARFAAGVVEGLNRHGLLNADAAKILLSENKDASK
jgi:hypothetical protein